MGSNTPQETNNQLAITANDRNDAESTQSLRSFTMGPVSSQRNTQHDTLSLTSCVSIPNDASGSHIAMTRRQPKNLQSLLNFAMQATQGEEDAPENMAPLDDQRRQFLEEALRSLTVNVTEVLDNAIKVLTNRELLNSIKEGDNLPDEVRNAFTILLDHVDDLDVANDFFKMGGFAMFPLCYSIGNAELRARASSVLGTLCQNNPFCQERAMTSGLLPVLCNLLHTEHGTALTKCLYAISCMCRGYEPACHELIKEGICPVLVDLLSYPDVPAKTKAAFLIRHFCQHFSTARKQFVRSNIVKVIAGHIKAGRNECTEHFLSILEVLVSSEDPVVLRLCKDQRYDLKRTLEEHLKLPELSDDRFLEEKEYCRFVLAAVFARPVIISNEEQADR